MTKLFELHAAVIAARDTHGLASEELDAALSAFMEEMLKAPEVPEEVLVEEIRSGFNPDDNLTGEEKRARLLTPTEDVSVAAQGVYLLRDLLAFERITFDPTRIAPWDAMSDRYCMPIVRA